MVKSFIVNEYAFTSYTLTDKFQFSLFPFVPNGVTSGIYLACGME